VDALNNLVWSLVGEDLWDKCQVIYPFLGGTTIDTHKWNIKNVADTNAAFRLTATVSAGFTYNESGIQSNTTTISNAQKLETYFLPSGVTNTNSIHLSAYINITPTLNASAIIGAATAALSNTPTYQLGRISAGTFLFATANAINTNFMSSGTISTGFYMPVRTGATTSAFYRNGIRVATSNAALNVPTSTVAIFNRNNYQAASNGRLAFVSFGDGLTAQESLDFYNIVQAYQTALGRQV
jgi:hypothetical protein